MSLPDRLRLLPAALFVAVCVLQVLAWLAWFPALVRDQPLTGVLEMLLLLALLANGWRVRHAVQVRSPAATRTATLMLAGLALCVLGDLVNRNFAQQFHVHEAVIEHSYLVDSILFFFPGYALFLVAIWQLARRQVPALPCVLLLAAGLLAGAFTFGTLAPAGLSVYSLFLTGAYTLLISLMVPAGIMLLLAFGRTALPVAAGAALATVADALIGHFWLFGSGHYPDIAYLNFVVYFLSQALLQQLPLLLLQQD